AVTGVPTASSPAAQTTAQAAYLAAVGPLPNLLGPDVAEYDAHCSVNLTTAACVQALEQFGSDMDASSPRSRMSLSPRCFRPKHSAEEGVGRPGRRARHAHRGDQRQ